LSETTKPDDEKAAAEFTRQTRKRRILFALSAFGVGAIALVGALFLFGGQLQTAEKARAGQARDELRRRFDAFRPQCAGLWRAIHAVDFAQVPEVRSRPLAARLAAGDLSCPEVTELAQSLPQKPGGGMPPRAEPQPSTGPAPLIRVAPGIHFGPQPASKPASAPASAPAP
jgi:hypothetical protein